MPSGPARRLLRRGSMADDSIHAHILACAARTDAETAGLAARILRACWPGGTDRTEPCARGWLRLWRPSRSGITPPACACPVGRCDVCN